MVIDKNYFLTRLANGEDINAIGQEMADLMNAAVAEHDATKKATDLANKKRELGLRMADLVKEYGELVAPGSMDGMTLSEEDVDSLVQAMDEMFNLMGAVVDLKKSLEEASAAKAPKKIQSVSDEEALEAFLKSILG